MTMMQEQAGNFAALAVALYAAHHVGDYWVQTDHQARHKGDAGADGALQCSLHVLSYLATQVVCVALIVWALGVQVSLTGLLVGLAVSGGTHYLADRREHGIMLKLARLLPGKAAFLKLGVPRDPWALEVLTPCSSCAGRGVQPDGACWDCQGAGSLPMMLSRADSPSLGTGAWALDQAWHIFWGVFVAALLMAAL